MSAIQWVFKIMEENPKATMSVAIGSMSFSLKYLIFDPYSHCGLLINTLRFLFTAVICIAMPIWLSVEEFQGFMDWGLAWLVRFIAAVASAIATYSLWKKARRNTTKKKITKARKDGAHKSR